MMPFVCLLIVVRNLVVAIHSTPLSECRGANFSARLLVAYS